MINIEQSLMDAIPTGDTVTWSKYLDANFFIITEDGTRFSRQSFLATFHSLPKGYSGYIKVTEPRIEFNENTAVIAYVSDEHEFVFGQELHTTYSSLNTYIKTDTSWMMIASEVFEIPKLPLPAKVLPDTLKRYTGIYFLNDTITCTISLENDTLFIQKETGGKQALLPETENVFFRLSDTRGRKIFVYDGQGNMLMLERRNGEDVVWKRIKTHQYLTCCLRSYQCVMINEVLRSSCRGTRQLINLKPLITHEISLPIISGLK